MNIDEVKRKIHSLNEDFCLETLEYLCEQISGSENGAQLIPDLLEVLEKNPNEDFGSPGCIVHTLEKYFRKGYEDYLVESVQKTPTLHTVWMLSRLINGVQGDERVRYIEVLQYVANNKKFDGNVRDEARSFLS